MPQKPRSNGVRVNRLSGENKYDASLLGRFIMAAHNKAIDGDIDAMQDYLQMMEDLVINIYNRSGEIQDICKANGDND